MNTSWGPLVLVLVVLAVMAGLFRGLFWKVMVVLVLEVLLFAVFPSLLVDLAHLVAALRGIIH